MNNRQEAATSCREYLNSLGMAYAYNTALFDQFYNQSKSYILNAYKMALSAADFLILNFQPLTQEVSNEYDN